MKIVVIGGTGLIGSRPSPFWVAEAMANHAANHAASTIHRRDESPVHDELW